MSRPDVVAEVTEAFARYERALVTRDLEALASSFATLPDVVRFGIADHQHGPDELARFREAQPAPPPRRTLTETLVTTYGEDVGVVSTLFSYPGRPTTGRQSQIWVKFAEGWRILHAHVSEVATGTIAD